MVKISGFYVKILVLRSNLGFSSQNGGYKMKTCQNVGVFPSQNVGSVSC